MAWHFFSLGREGVLPAPPSRVHTAHGSPHIGRLTQIMLAAVVVTVFAFSGNNLGPALFNWFTNLGVLDAILLLTLSSAAAVASFADDHHGENAWNCLVAPPVACWDWLPYSSPACSAATPCSAPKSALHSHGCCPKLFSPPPFWAWAFAVYLRLTRPGSYARIGGSA